MNSTLLNSEIQDFIDCNIGGEISLLALKKSKFPNANWVEVLNQIQSKTKARGKLPTWFAAKRIIYPSKISIEQTSSEQTAQYKASLINGETLIDLTGGFGVDDYYFSKKFKTIIHCEINLALSEVVNHNFTELGLENIQCYAEDGYDTLKTLQKKFSWIYIDPSRRDNLKGKVFLLKDCLPNVPQNLDYYFNYSNNILIKTAPILDIKAGLSELKYVKKIHIVALDNEVKELLWELEKGFLGKIIIQTVNIVKEDFSRFEFYMDDNIENKAYSLPQKYLYEPNSAIMKSGGFEIISASYNVGKLHQHSHLYTSNEVKTFPGRTFEIENTFEYNKANMKQFLVNENANITIRNFPETVEAIRKKWKIKDGGRKYCFFTTNLNNIKTVLICKKINI